MSFWEDASPVVKGAIVLGIIGIIVAALAWAGVGPFDPGVEDTTQERGLQPPGAAGAAE